MIELDVSHLMEKQKSTRPGRPWDHGDPRVAERGRRRVLDAMISSRRGYVAHISSPEPGVPKTHKTTMGYLLWLEDSGYARSEQVSETTLVYRWTGIEMDYE